MSVTLDVSLIDGETLLSIHSMHMKKVDMCFDRLYYHYGVPVEGRCYTWMHKFDDELCNSNIDVSEEALSEAIDELIQRILNCMYDNQVYELCIDFERAIKEHREAVRGTPAEMLFDGEIEVMEK